MIPVYQKTHGYAVGLWVRQVTQASYVSAMADSVAHAAVVGMVSRIISVDRYEIATPGETVSGLANLLPGKIYYLSDVTAGAIQTTQPAISAPVLAATSNAGGVVLSPPIATTAATAGYPVLRDPTTGRALIADPSGGQEITNYQTVVAYVTATSIPLATVVAKGDLIVATGVGVVTHLTVGSDTQMLVADHTTPSGLKWTNQVVLLHATTHEDGGTDPIKLDQLAQPDDVTTLNATTSAHGLQKKLSGNAAQYMDGSGNYSTPAVGVGGSASGIARYTTTSGQSFAPSTETIINYDTVDVDSASAVTTGASWKFTAPTSGPYTIRASAVLQFSSYVNGDVAKLFLFKNGVKFSTLCWFAVTASTSQTIELVGDDTIQLTGGDTIDVRLVQTDAGSATLDTTAGVNHIAVVGEVGGDGAAGAAGAGYQATSTTSVVTAGSGSKSFTTQTGLAYSVGARIRVTSRGTSEWMEGIVSSYSGSTLVATMDSNSGTGTHTDWDINVAGQPGTVTNNASIALFLAQNFI